MTRRVLAALICVAVLSCAAFARAQATESPSPTPLPTPTPAPVEPEIDGIKLGDDAAAVLLRLKLHPPGWARQPGAANEGRQLPTDNKKATLLIVFDKTIEQIVVRTNIEGSQVVDAYGVKLGGTLTELIQLRGAPIAILGDSTYVYGQPNVIRWVYVLKEGKIDSISVADCRISGVCDVLQGG